MCTNQSVLHTHIHIMLVDFQFIPTCVVKTIMCSYMHPWSTENITLQYHTTEQFTLHVRVTDSGTSRLFLKLFESLLSHHDAWIVTVVYSYVCGIFNIACFIKKRNTAWKGSPYSWYLFLDNINSINLSIYICSKLLSMSWFWLLTAGIYKVLVTLVTS